MSGIRLTPAQAVVALAATILLVFLLCFAGEQSTPAFGAAAGNGGGVFESAVIKDDIDFEGCKTYHGGKVTPAEANSILNIMGWRTPPDASYWSAGRRDEKDTDDTYKYVLPFRRPVQIGSILLSEMGPQSVLTLKPEVTAAPDPANESQWQPMSLMPHQSGGVLAVASAANPPATRAILVIDKMPHNGLSYTRRILCFKNRLISVTPIAHAYAESEYTAYSSGGGPPAIYYAENVINATGAWVNTGGNERGRVPRAPVSDVDPAWFMLVWKENQTISGLRVFGNPSAINVETFVGDDSLNPRAGTGKEWRLLRDAKLTHDDVGRSCMISFDPVKTRGLRLNIIKAGDNSPVAEIWGLHAFVNLEQGPVPAGAGTMAVAAQQDAPVKIPFHMDFDGEATIVVNTPDGHRVKNVMARRDRKQGDNLEAWDLTDEQGRTVEPGTYKWKMISHPPLQYRYEFTPYPNVTTNAPDNAPWLNNFSGKDGWMADHTAPHAGAAAGDLVFFGSPVSESGVSLIACDLEGKKKWAVPQFAGFTGVGYLAADENFAYVTTCAGNTAAAWGVDGTTEAVWAVDNKTHDFTEVGRLTPTATRKRGVQATAAHDGKLYLSVRAPEDWFTSCASAIDVDITRCFPQYLPLRKPRFPYEMVPDPRGDFMRLLRMTGSVAGGYSIDYLESTRGKSARRHVMVAFNKPIAIGTAIYPQSPDPGVNVKISALKPDAKYPPNPGDPTQWIDFATQGKLAWDIAQAPPNFKTRALRISFYKNEDDVFSDADESAEFKADANENASSALDDKPAKEDKAANLDSGEGWAGRIEGLKLFARRYTNATATASVRVSSGSVGPDGVWDAKRTEALSEANPGIYVQEWKTPQKIRGLAFKEIDGRRTLIDIYTGPADKPIDIKSNDGWEKLGEYIQPRRDKHMGFGSYNGRARYLDGSFDFGKIVETRAVRLRVVEQWIEVGEQGPREDQKDPQVDLARCRVMGVAALTYVGGEPSDGTDQKTFHRIEVLDPKTKSIVGEIGLDRPGPIAFNNAGELIAISDVSIVKLDPKNPTAPPVVLSKDDLKIPTAMACDASGKIYVYDNAPDRRNVRVYDASGKYLSSIGEAGGYVVGPWNENRTQEVTAIAVDKNSKLWMIESNYYPKRITRWSIDGKFEKEFLGNTPYGGGGCLDPYDKRRLFYGPLEFELDWQTGKTRLKNLTWLGTTPAGEVPVQVNGHTYLTTRGNGFAGQMPCGIVYLYEKDHLKLAAAMGYTGGFDPLAKPEMLAALKLNSVNDHSFIWCDRNSNGEVDPEEVVIDPRPGRTAVTRFNRDLSAQAYSYGYRVKEFLPSGVPIYEEVDVPNLTKAAGPLIRFADGTYHAMGGCVSTTIETGYDANGNVMWTYPSERAGTDGIVTAKPLSPEQVVCQFDFIGMEKAPKGDLGEFTMCHTNLGDYNVWTSDGLLAARIFRDLRDPKARAWSFPEHDRGLDLHDLTIGQEHFQSYFCKTEDDKYYAVAGHNHISIVEMIGLDKFKRQEGEIKVTNDDLVKTIAWQQTRQKDEIYERAPVVDCFRVDSAPTIDGNYGDWETAPWVDFGEKYRGRVATGASFAAQYDDHNLYLCYNVIGLGPMKNSGEQWDRLFKTGAAVDLQIALDPDAPADRKAPVAGDKRILMTFTGEKHKPTVVLYDAVVPGTKPEDAWKAVSPVTSISFDKVKQLDNVRIACNNFDGNYTVEVAIPLDVLGLKPTGETRLKLDWGVLATDDAGNSVLRRLYWSNKATGVIADVPTEARLVPGLWGHILFHDRVRSETANPKSIDVGKHGGAVDKKTDSMLNDFENELEDDAKGGGSKSKKK